MVLTVRVERPLPAEGQGPRITEVWAWCAVDPLTDTEGIVAAKLPGGGGLPLVTTMRSMAERIRPLAEAAVRAAEEPRPVLALRRFLPAEGDPAAREVDLVARTLRFVAFLLQDQYGGCDPTVKEPTGWAEHWRDVAGVLEQHGVAALEGCCPLCQEVTCDDGCPLAEVRA